MAKRKHISASLDEELVKDMEKIRNETGVSVSQQINLRLKGYKIIKIK